MQRNFDLGEIRRELAADSMAPVHAQVAEDRERFRRRREELAEGDVLAEEARLMNAAVPTSRWPAHLPGRRRWDVYAAQVEAAQRQEYEARREVQRLELEPEAEEGSELEQWDVKRREMHDLNALYEHLAKSKR